LMKKEPENLVPLELCVSMLRHAKQYAAASRIVESWIAARPTREEDLIWARAVVLQAEILADQKKWDQAWKVIKPAMSTGKGDALLDGAWIQEELGDWDTALEIGRAVLGRYPDAVQAHAFVARVLWRQQHYLEAAELLTSSRQLRRNDWEGTIANSFGWVFFDADPHFAQNAFNALRQRNVDASSLAAFARDVGARGNHKLAFALLRQIGSLPSASAGPSFGSMLTIWSRDEIAASDGEGAAADWLRKNTEIPHQLALVAFEDGRYDILAEPLEDPARQTKVNEMQVLRTAALLMRRSPDAAGREELRRYFASQPPDVWTVYGLYLLGHASEEELFATSAKWPAGLANVAWLKGVRAAGDGRYADASEWFSVAVDTDLENAPPTAFAYMTLRRWMREDKPLSLLGELPSRGAKTGS
jgi:tetratricopeptide (TPR) repeat protein